MWELNKLLKEKLVDFGKLELTGWDIIWIMGIVAGTKLLLYFIKRSIIRYNRRRHDKHWDGNSNAIFQLIKYIVWVFSLISILNTANINLSFLVAGSAALLVGIGFGLQQIFQDIISGIFMLIERNVKVGDVMEVDSYIGHITNIGLRTSTIVTRDGTNIIVPNHKFITSNVLNWSNAEQMMRFKVAIGVAYGSDVKLVTDLLRESAVEHPDAIENETHRFSVRLVEFAQSSLHFELLFWTTKKFKVEDVKSELRLMILEKFRQHGISIPFPQHDVHIISKGTSEEPGNV